MAEPTPRFKLSFMAIFKWVMIVFGLGAGTAFIFLGVALYAFYAMSRMPLDQFFAPAALAIMPVLMLAVTLIPLSAVIVLLFTRSVAYDVTEDGIVQFVGPMKNHIDWIAMNSVAVKRAAGIEQWTFGVITKDQPFVVFASFLARYEDFVEAILQQAPADHPVHRA